MIKVCHYERFNTKGNEKRVWFYFERCFTIVFNSEEVGSWIQTWCSLPFVDEHSGCQKSAVTHENIENIHNAVLTDWQMKIHEIGDIANISIDHVHMLHKHFLMRKLSVRWVLCLLTVDQKYIWMNLSQKVWICLIQSTKFLWCSNTDDKTCLLYTSRCV